VIIDRQLIAVRSDMPVFGPVNDRKNRARTILLPDVVLDTLPAHMAKFGLGPERLPFTGSRCAPIRRTTCSTIWIGAAGPLKVPLGDGFHELRISTPAC
jgi:hypothetical protein